MPKHYSLAAWQEARAVVLLLLEVNKSDWQARASAIFSQANRAALSVQLNIAEGWAFGPSPSCVRHLRIAYGSATETSDLIALLIDSGIVNGDSGARLRLHNDRSLRLLTGLLKQHRNTVRGELQLKRPTLPEA
ncbi:MAG TPA: four helix bundle protein [Gemmatimonadales bacterium]|nr:four helix bundle protein [Gemmatimonadales bacterium]